MAHEALPARPSASVPAPGDDLRDDPRAAQFLATEHWSLLATRSLSWNESFSRAGMFLSTLSAATVTLALVGPATGFGAEFVIFALVILSITLFLGVATFVRLTQVNNEDLYWVAGMNRLRSEYVRLAPGIERSFFAGWTLDNPGISRTFGAVNVIGSPAPLHMLVTTPAVIGVIASAIAGVMAGLVAIQVSAGMAPAVGIGLVVFVASVALCLLYGVREGRAHLRRLYAFIGEVGAPEPPAATRPDTGPS